MTESTGHAAPVWDERREELKNRWVGERGSWTSYWEDLLRYDPDFFEAYLNFYRATSRRSVIPPKYRELIYIAVDASVTTLYEPGWRHHLRQAFAHGATLEEVMEVHAMVSAIGIHSCNIGFPLMLEEHERHVRSLEE